MEVSGRLSMRCAMKETRSTRRASSRVSRAVGRRSEKALSSEEGARHELIKSRTASMLRREWMGGEGRVGRQGKSEGGMVVRKKGMEAMDFRERGEGGIEMERVESGKGAEEGATPKEGKRIRKRECSKIREEGGKEGKGGEAI